MIKSIIGAGIVVAVSMGTVPVAYATNGESHGQSKQHATHSHQNNAGKGNSYGKNHQHHPKNEQHKNSGAHSQPTSVKPAEKPEKIHYTTPEKHKETPKPAQGKTSNHIAVTICHKTGSAKNPYVKITVDDDAITKQGHGVHQDHGDIVPPFTDDEGNVYPGLNWTAEGKAIWNNGCKPVETKAPVAVTPVKKDTTPTKPAEKTPVVAEETKEEAKKVETVAKKSPATDALPRTGGIHASLTALIGLMLAGFTTGASYIVRDRLFTK